ncbi:MAG: tripartite tricarboxylate transporter TctB family protein [Zoogloeaceae bacterium]|nr:tripartite tricarboxylate transporter TctB family protein [Zoogloeaceae bacterium]
MALAAMRLDDQEDFFMRDSLFRQPDCLAGSLFFLTGLATLAGSWRYPVGTAMRMGAGYFPQLLGGLLAVLGVAVLLRAWLVWRRCPHDDLHSFLRPMSRWVFSHMTRRALRSAALVGAGVLAFAGLLGSLGLAGATLLLVTVSGAAHHEARLKELLPLGLALAAFGAGVFVWGLGLPLPLFPG